jgi:hypothetical protein
LPCSHPCLAATVPPAQATAGAMQATAGAMQSVQAISGVRAVAWPADWNEPTPQPRQPDVRHRLLGGRRAVQRLDRSIFASAFRAREQRPGSVLLVHKLSTDPGRGWRPDDAWVLSNSKARSATRGARRPDCLTGAEPRARALRRPCVRGELGKGKVCGSWDPALLLV